MDTNTLLIQSSVSEPDMTTTGPNLLAQNKTDITTSGTMLVTETLDDGYRIMLFFQKILILNDTSGSFITVFRPSFLRGSSSMAIFCMDIGMELIGIIGNLVSICVLAHRTLRSSTSLLLSSLAVYDSIFLLTMLATMLNEATGERAHYTPGEATALNTIFQTSGMASVFTVVAVTVERYIAVRNPMKARVFCTSSTAWKGVLFIVSVSFISSIPRLFQLYQVENNVSTKLRSCAQSTDKSILHLIYCSLFPVIFILVIPFMIISALNICILRGLIRRGRSLKSLDGTGNILNGDKLTFATLGTSSFFFLCCTFPAIHVTIDGVRPDLTYALEETVIDICSSLVILNFSANFLFYCILGRAFRTVLLERFCCRPKPSVSDRQSSYHRNRLSSERATSL